MLLRISLALFSLISPCSSFLWTLFGNLGCNCCRCPQSFPSQMVPRMFTTPNTPAHSFPIFTPPPYFGSPVQSYSFSRDYASQNHPVTSTLSYRGPPAAAPISQEQVQQDERKYSTNQVEYNSDLRPAAAAEYSDNALSQLEDELAAEKYKHNQNREMERKENQRQDRIRVFKIRPHKPKVHNGMVEWQSSQVAKYTNEKAVDRFTEASTNDLGDDLEEFIPIEIGNEPELADEEPAGPPPNVRNRISHDPIYVLRRRRVINW